MAAVPSTRDETRLGCTISRWQFCLRLHPNLVAFNHTISTCGKTSEWRVALALLGKLKRERTEAGRSADIYSYNSAIGACEKGHVWETALSLTMECMEGRMKCMGCLERRMSFDAVTLNTALSSCGKSEKWPQAFQAFHLAKVLDLCDVFTLNSALSASERVTLWRSALSTLAATATSQSTPEISKRSGQLSCRPDVISFNSLISVCARADQWRRAKQFFDFQQVGQRKSKESAKRCEALRKPFLNFSYIIALFYIPVQFAMRIVFDGWKL
ncbi:unnamed protein product [Durusdinium trenchii]|uniref:Pentatricopeptide repeat-containing protein n=1 Tax=Durusdinium trenchii TaxID=1381693 RepID=A0ABP0HPU7_9DINO